MKFFWFKSVLLLRERYCLSGPSSSDNSILTKLSVIPFCHGRGELSLTNLIQNGIRSLVKVPVLQKAIIELYRIKYVILIGL